ncbi:MAG TPA: FadR/GntR family transcriptional regulator [Syntrophomonas sp.]|nr:FadR/GntR family transcriptional regulator [Syntrophomonas sp.]
MKKSSEIQSVSQQIVEDLLNSILRGELKLGQKLPSETSLAETYGVSRPTIRSALSILETEHIVQSKKGCQGGWYISNSDTNQVANYLGRYMALSINSNAISSAHLAEIRTIVEVKGCGLAAIRRTPEDLQAIAAAIPVHYQSLNDYEYHSQDIEFHRRVAEATHNPLLVITIRATTMAQELFAMTSPAPDRIRRELNQSLLTIYQAIVEQNSRRAEEAMLEHLGYYKRLSGSTYFKVE